MSYSSELEAFRDYAAVYPDTTVLLIDTFDTLKTGLPNAIIVAKELEAKGHRLQAVRLDSGDLAYLSKAVRQGLDAANLPYVKILASSDIDEYVVANLKQQDAKIDVYGVGTRLVTAFQEPALGGVYKIVALEQAGTWRSKIKISSNPAKTTIPGRKQIWRWESQGAYLGDALSLLDEPPPVRMRHPDLSYKQTDLPPSELAPLLLPRIIAGERVTKLVSTKESQTHARAELRKLPEEHQRLTHPHTYRVGLSEDLWEHRHSMIEDAISNQTA
jgi:nicotinate phosphoribosyltransferase